MLRPFDLVICCAATLSAPALAKEKWTQEGVLPPGERATSAFSDDPDHQFDFWIGEWEVNLRKRQPDFSWEDSVAARPFIYPILNGKAILELWDSEPIKGYSLRCYDPQTEKWKLWLNWPGKNRSNASMLEGRFRHGRGDFFSSFTNAEGEEVTSHFSFNDISADALRWDDRYSSDGGDTWRDNWRMEWTRTASEPEWPIPGDTAHTYDHGSRCDEPQFRAHEPLAGAWKGTRTRNGKTQKAEMRGYKILDGCAVMAFIRAGGEEWFFFSFYSTGAKRWESHMLSDKSGEPLVQLAASDNEYMLANEAGDVTHRWSFDDGAALTISSPEGDVSFEFEKR